jgi:hypothetical protein
VVERHKRADYGTLHSSIGTRVERNGVSERESEFGYIVIALGCALILGVAKL